jgi:hypothetical protein
MTCYGLGAEADGDTRVGFLAGFIPPSCLFVYTGPIGLTGLPWTDDDDDDDAYYCNMHHHADSALVLVAYFCQERGRMRKEGSGYGVPTKLVRMITFHTRTNMSTNIHYDDGVND